MLRVLIPAALLAALGTAHAAETTAPSTAQIREAHDASAAAVEAARQAPPAAASDTALAGAVGAASRAAERPGTMPAIEPHPDTAAAVRALMARARTGTLFDTPAATARSAEARPLVFVSLSMPEPSLRALVEQSRPIGAALVLRGLVDDSMKRTVARLGELLGLDGTAPSEDGPGSDINLMIDPTLFERFDVRAVPTFVLPLDPPGPCTTAAGCPVPRHVKLAGDVGLRHALEIVSREARDAEARAAAARWVATSETPE